MPRLSTREALRKIRHQNGVYHIHLMENGAPILTETLTRDDFIEHRKEEDTMHTLKARYEKKLFQRYIDASLPTEGLTFAWDFEQ